MADDSTPHPDHRLAQLARAAARLSSDTLAPAVSGEVTAVGEDGARIAGLSRSVNLGDALEFRTKDGTETGRVVRIGGETVFARSFARTSRAAIGDRVAAKGALSVAPGPHWLGRVVDGLGRPIDGEGPLAPAPARPLSAAPPDPLLRRTVCERLRTGVRAIDVFAPLCLGQRIGLFAGAGVGKTRLLGLLAGTPGFDAVVVALVGERGREVRDLLDDSLGEARARSVLVASTADESAMMRSLAPETAMTAAEALRDEGLSVLLMVDSVTRYCHALRDVATSAGEMPVVRGYPPSVFSALPLLFERAGPGPGPGTVTALFAVLLDGDDPDEPVADAIRGSLDGHILLDRATAARGRYPAIDVLGSLSRLADRVWSHDQRRLVREVRSMAVRFEDTRDLRAMGGYRPGSDPELDRAVLLVPAIEELLTQEGLAPDEEDTFELVATRLHQLLQPAPAGE